MSPAVRLRRIPLHHRTPLRQEVPRKHAQTPGPAAQSWALRDTSTGQDEAQSGQDWARGGEDEESTMSRTARRKRESSSAGKNDPHTMEFLAQPGVVAFNLAVEDDGELRIKLDELGDRQFFRVIATDPVTAVERNVALPSRNTKIQDLRLASGLNPKRHFHPARSGHYPRTQQGPHHRRHCHGQLRGLRDHRRRLSPLQDT